MADLAEAHGVIGVAAHQGGHVEGDAEAAPAAAQDHVIALVGLLGVAEAGELPEDSVPYAGSTAIPDSVEKSASRTRELW